MDLPNVMMVLAILWMRRCSMCRLRECLAGGHHDLEQKKPRVIPMRMAMLMAQVAYWRVRQSEPIILW